MVLSTNYKARENRCRRASERQGYRLIKCARRDALADGYGLFTLVNVRSQPATDHYRGQPGSSEAIAHGPLSLNQVEQFLGVRVGG